MANYVDAGSQTIWAGLMQRETVRPDILLSPPRDTTTPPDEMMITEKSQFVHGIPSITQPQHKHQDPAATMSLLERRLNRVGLDPHMVLPSSELNDEVPRSPPPTQALLSPLPEANKRHAGHTPLIPRALSPAPEAEAPLENEHQTMKDGTATPDVDEALTGALTLPSNPVDGAEDHIELDALDHVLSKIAKQQATLRGEGLDDDEPEPKAQPTSALIDTAEDGLRLSRKGSADSRRSGATEEYDGVILKSPPSNFGAPLGSL
jgi:hypothetical protein